LQLALGTLEAPDSVADGSTVVSSAKRGEHGLLVLEAKLLVPGHRSLLFNGHGTQPAFLIGQ
jgi:hypothetical protein